MGADIHLYVEKLGQEGKWEAVRGANPDIARNRGYAERSWTRNDEEQALKYEAQANAIENGTKLLTAEDDYERNHYGPEVLQGWLYDGRNYDLFAILADVRNGRGFAGMYTGEGFVPIVNSLYGLEEESTRGIPDDVSEEIKEACEDYGCDGHSHNWLTVKELTEYDWEQVTKSLKPGSYPMDMSEEQLKENTEQYTYKYSAGSFYTESIPKLKELAGDNLEGVRIVFWFDN